MTEQNTCYELGKVIGRWWRQRAGMSYELKEQLEIGFGSALAFGVCFAALYLNQFAHTAVIVLGLYAVASFLTRKLPERWDHNMMVSVLWGLGLIGLFSIFAPR